MRTANNYLRWRPDVRAGLGRRLQLANEASRPDFFDDLRLFGGELAGATAGVAVARWRCGENGSSAGWAARPADGVRRCVGVNDLMGDCVCVFEMRIGECCGLVGRGRSYAHYNKFQ